MSHGGGSERWLVSYADFITLLMVLFVVLYSMSQVDVYKYKQLADGLRVGFGAGGSTKIVEPSISQGKDTEEQPAPIVIPGIPQAPPASVEVANQLTDLLYKADLGGVVSVQNNVEGVLISLSEKIVFEQGNANLLPDALPVLDTVIEMISPIDNQIRVIGHTDDSTPADERYPTNWELSVARALTIVNYLTERGISPNRLTVSGRGEFEPVFANDTPEHKIINGRAEIIIVYNIDEDFIDLDITP